MADRGMTAAAPALRGAGLDVVRFNFPYREKGSKRPDPMPVLKDCLAKVIEDTRSQLNPRLLVIGGRSMGGRVASMLAADGFQCDGLLLLAYPHSGVAAVLPAGLLFVELTMKLVKVTHA